LSAAAGITGSTTVTDDAPATVHVVEDDETLRAALSWLFESAGHSVAAHPSAESFLVQYDPQQPGCLVLDIRLPGMSGIELQDVLRRRAITLPIIFLTGYADVPIAVKAVKQGAVEFIEKPFNNQVLLKKIENALKLDTDQRREQARKLSAAARLQTLTPREREIMQYIIAGKMNKTMAHELCISIKTVEAHRSKVMQKMGVDSVAELVQLALESGLRDGKY
jgi:two-component system response regulator FixJ